MEKTTMLKLKFMGRDEKEHQCAVELKQAQTINLPLLFLATRKEVHAITDKIWKEMAGFFRYLIIFIDLNLYKIKFLMF